MKSTVDPGFVLHRLKSHWNESDGGLSHSSPALGARYFILSILSSALVSIVFNKLGNLLLVQS
jgi:hypothetical protein